jgi:ABC-type dipeptide/oligopeptide/nickel transport system permease component
MWQYTLKRLLQGVITVWFIATATFVAMHSVPGDPISGERATTEAIRANLAARYGLDKPL